MNLKFSRHLVESHLSEITNSYVCTVDSKDTRVVKIHVPRERKHNDVICSGYQVAEWLHWARRSYERRQQVTPFYWSTVADWWWGLIWLMMIDHCYVINESFTHPSDKWMICVATIMFIYSYFIYKLPHKFLSNLKALEIRKNHENVKVVELLSSAKFALLK